MIQIDLNFKSPVPLFEQMKEQLRLLVISGLLRPGDQLPSIRQLAVQLNVNPNTVAKVYRELEQEGFLSSQQGRGCFVPPELPVPPEAQRLALIRNDIGRLLEKARTLGFTREDLIRLLQEVAID